MSSAASRPLRGPRVSSVLAGVAGCLLFAAAALAQPRAPAVDKEGFESVSLPAMKAGEGEGLPAASLVATAYSFIWLAVLVFVGSVAFRARRLEGQIQDLAAEVEGRYQVRLGELEREVAALKKQTAKG